MDWFEQLTGFKERSYAETQKDLVFEGNSLFCPAVNKHYDLGEFEIPSLLELRQRVTELYPPENIQFEASKITQQSVRADAYKLHGAAEAKGAVIQVASQFNLLEMISPNMSPEDGVTRYQHDPTQGPACAMATGPATIFRNYGIMIDGKQGQTKDRQINTMDKLIKALDIQEIEMRNGYAMISRAGLEACNEKIRNLSAAQREEIKSLLKVGVQWSTTVTAKNAAENQKVTQVFCSALPISYNREQSTQLWEPLARIVLEACYEATLLIGIINSLQTKNPKVYLTRVGGGVFGNEDAWIGLAIDLAIERIAEHHIDVIHVSR